MIFKIKSYFFLLITIALCLIKNDIFSKIIEIKNSEQNNNFHNNQSSPINSHVDNFVEVLMGVGFTKASAEKAINVLLKACPLEILREHSYLIVPSTEKKIISFAFNINNSDAIIIKRNETQYEAFLTDTELAKKLVSERITNYSEIKNIIKIDSSENKFNKNISYEKIEFKKGDTLLRLLKDSVSNKTKLKRLIIQVKDIIDPYKIKIGTEGSLIKINNQLLAFYIEINSKEYLLATLNGKEYKINKVKKNELESLLNNKLTYTNKKKNIITRVNIFNNPKYIIKNNILKKGESIYEILATYKIHNKEIAKILKSIKPYFDVKKIKIGKTIDVVFYNKKFLGLSYKISKIESLQVVKIENTYKAYIYKKAYKKKSTQSEIVIINNLYNDSKQVNLPKGIFIELVKLLSFSLDFQRDIRKNTKFLILYENLYDYNGNFITNGKILYSQVSLNNNKVEMFYFENSFGQGEYFDNNGKSIRKTLMKTPIDGARLSSGFGKRKHPILGYNKMHKGLDFAAKKGTPVYAAGDGIIERANFFGGYGRYIRIKHNSEYKTAYAHLSGFSRGIKKNIRVKQGQIIGYVGSTGRSTGPHLHYEVLYYNKQINPSKIKFKEIEKLDGENLINFYKQRDKTIKILNN